MRRALWLTVTLVLCMACRSRTPGPAPTDAGGTDSGSTDDAGTGVAPPVFVCPPGWRTTTDGGCVPWAADRPPCADATARFVGEAECAPVGSACPADGWPADLPTDRPVLYVRDGSSGNGTRGDPYGSILEATIDATPGTVIAVATGVYDETVRLLQPLELRGACAAGVQIISSEPREGTGVINVSGAAAEIHDVQLGPSPRPGLFVIGADTSAVVRNVAIVGTQTLGALVMDGAQLDVDGLLVRGTRSRPSDGWLGRGLDVLEGASATVRRAVFDDNVDGAVFVNASELHLSDAALRRTRFRPTDMDFGRGLVVEFSRVTAERTVVEHNYDVGVSVLGADASAELTDVWIRNTRPREINGLNGRGLNVELGAAVVARRLGVVNNGEVNVLVLGAPTQLTLTDAIVADGVTEADGGSARGVAVVDGANATLSRVLITRHREVSFAVDDPTSVATLTDVEIGPTNDTTCMADTCAATGGGGLSGGIGVGAFRRGTLSMDRFLIRDATLCGLMINSPNVTLGTGVIIGNEIGVNVQDEDFDFTGQVVGVSFVDNVRRLDSAVLPIPDAVLPRQ